MKPLQRLALRPGVTTVDGDAALAFTREHAPGILLVPGDPSRPEVTDLAVVLGELADAHPGVRVGVAREGDEAEMRSRLGLSAFPSLLFVKGGEVVKVLARMQSWSTYAGAARALEASS